MILDTVKMYTRLRTLMMNARQIEQALFKIAHPLILTSFISSV